LILFLELHPILTLLCQQLKIIQLFAQVVESGVVDYHSSYPNGGC